jgi:hypothetical protein
VVAPSGRLDLALLHARDPGVAPVPSRTSP